MKAYVGMAEQDGDVLIVVERDHLSAVAALGRILGPAALQTPVKIKEVKVGRVYRNLDKEASVHFDVH